MNFDFHNSESLKTLAGTKLNLKKLLPLLRTYQRIFRIQADEVLADKLMTRGLRSAHHIARIPKHKFLKDHSDLFEGSVGQTNKFYDKASKIRSKVKHVVANFRDIAAAPHFRNSLFYNVSEELENYVKELPSYQDLFGSLDYCECPDCSSIISPSAYFLDIMRITDQYITDANEGRIPPGYKLEDRRPDLFAKIKLDCKDTLTPIPFLTLVNQILVAKLTKDLTQLPFKELALATYPFNLPFLLPHFQIHTYLDALNISLGEIYQTMLAPELIKSGFEDINIVREYLGLSPEDLKLVTTVFTQQGISDMYGFQDITKQLPAKGTGTVTIVTNTDKVTGINVDFTTVLVEGQQIQVGEEIRTVKTINSATDLTTDLPWKNGYTSSKYTIFPIQDLSTTTTFCYRTNLEYDQVKTLFIQGLSPEELVQGVPNSFYINKADPTFPYLRISQNFGGDTDNAVTRIEGIYDAANFTVAYGRLDRISRFVRLAQKADLTFETLDWLLTATGSAEINNDFILLLASIKQQSQLTGMTMIEVSSFIAPIKTIGKGIGLNPADPFDVIFNNPNLLKGLNPLTELTPIPFDLNRPLSWNVNETPDNPTLQGTIISATATTANLGSNASSVDDYYLGQSIRIIDGTGKGGYAVIKSYNGTTQTATIYDKWATTPTSTSKFTITNAKNLNERLAAGLQVTALENTALGNYLAKLLDTKEAPILLNLDNLTLLYRLAKIPNIYKMSIDEYLCFLSLLFYPDRACGNPPKENTVSDILLLKRLTKITNNLEWLQTTSFSVYDLGYIISGKKSRYLRPPYSNEDLPSFIEELATQSKESLLSNQELEVVTADPLLAEDLYKELVTQGFINESGVILWNEVNFNDHAKLFPIANTDFEKQGLITAATSKEVFSILSAQQPPVLNVSGTATSGELNIYYTPQTDLSYLFINDDEADLKRQQVQNVLNNTLASIKFSQLTSLLLLTNKAFVSEDINDLNSQHVFDTLVAQNPPLLELKNAPDKTIGFLTSKYNSDNKLDFLFDSKGAGESGTITAYDGTTKIATIGTNWTIDPNYFSIYQITRLEVSATAKSATKDTIALAAGSSTKDGFYNGMLLFITDGKGKGETRTIIDYNGSTMEATVDVDWIDIPDSTSTYSIEEEATTGTAQASGATILTLAEDASATNDFYKSMTLRIIEDVDAQTKRDEVSDILNLQLEKVGQLSQLLNETQTLQENNVSNGIADFIGAKEPTISALIPFAASYYSVGVVLADFLSPDKTAAVSPIVIALIDGLSRSGLMAETLNIDDASLLAIARRPDHFDIENTARIDLKNIQTLAAYETFIDSFSDSEQGLIKYFDLPVDNNCEGEKIAQLSLVTGWNPEQICQLTDFYWPVEKQNGIGNMQGILQLSLPFGLIKKAGFDANYLIKSSALATLELGPLNGTIDAQNWNRYTDIAESSLSAVAAKFPESEFDALSSDLQSKVDVAKRDALLGYTIWHLQKSFPEIQEPSDLFNFLLIDVEMSGCDVTSQIAQGITSVQLYMQRARMGLEPGAATDQIPEIWWEWMSTYRLWEVNRKIFLYPENYIEPALRKNPTPQFTELINQLLQGTATESNVQSAYLKYFEEFRNLATLQQGPSYANTIIELDGQLETETTYFIGRSVTTPFKYYQRQLVKTNNCDTAAWSPWLEIKATINSAFVTPIFALNRLFIFWMEEQSTKSSILKGQETITQSMNTAELKFTFQNIDGEWVQQQTIGGKLPFQVLENSNPLLQNANVKSAYDINQQFWIQPYAQGIDRGIPANGVLNFVANSSNAAGKNTDFARQVFIGDYIWAAGEKRRVTDVDGQQLLLDRPWTIMGTDAPFKVIPRDKDKNVFSPFKGTGTVLINKNFDLVKGLNTKFLAEVSIGDNIQVLNESRTVIGMDIADNTLIVDKNWDITSGTTGAGTVSTFSNLIQVLGSGTSFTTQLKSGDVISIGGVSKVVDEIDDDTNLTVETAFNSATSGTAYFINSYVPYDLVPRSNGAEKLLVFYGPNLNSVTAPPANNAVIKSNPGDDPFLASLNAYNNSLNQTLQLGASARSENDAGELTGALTFVLGGGLAQQQTRLLAPNYNATVAQTAQPIRGNLSRENDLLEINLGANYLVNLYWSNTSREKPKNQNSLGSGNGRPLLYHVSGTNASINGVGNQLGALIFNNQDQAYLIKADNIKLNEVSQTAFLTPYAVINNQTEMRLDFGPYTVDNVDFNNLKFKFTRLTTNVVDELYQRLFIGGFDTLLSLDSQMLAELPFGDFYQIPKGTPPDTIDTDYLPSPIMDFDGAYGIYFWEIFFHTVLLVGDNYKTAQQFADAKKWYEYIFDPMGDPRPDDIHENDRYYKFRPFRNMDIPTMTEILTNQCEINAFNSDPFDPDAIARLRISAYAKATVMKYIDNIIQWGDALFSQDTRESIAQATNLYILAKDLLGPRPINVGNCPIPIPKTFNQIKAEYPNGIPEFLVEVENTVFMMGCIDKTDYAGVPFNEVDSSYFCIPENKELIGFWNRIDDRLFKIRHCMNIQGQERPLALFAPPLDPRQVIQAFGAGGGGFGVTSYSPVAIPPYRSGYLIAQAKALIAQVSGLGGALLSALEKKDAAALGMLQLNQQATILNLMTSIKENQIEQLKEEGSALNMAKKSTDDRFNYYSGLIDDGLNAGEVAEITLSILATVFESIAIPLKAAGAVTKLLPDVGSPFAMVYGGEAVGGSFATAGTVFEILGKVTKLSADMSGKAGGYNRRAADWEFQKKLASNDQSQYTYLQAAQVKKEEIAQQDLAMHNTSIKQNKDQEDFLRKKFSNGELYNWMVSRLSATYFQAYSIAIDMARQAERAYQYEWSTNNSFINFGYWDNLHKGLTAGEGLMLALTQMETFITTRSVRGLEIEKSISLKSLNPIAFLDLIRTGECLFDFNEELFDRDFPGHYKRKIKSITLSVKDKSGNFINLNGTLRQVSNQLITTPDLTAVRFLLGEDVGENPGNLLVNVNVLQQIAISKGENNTGLFHFNFTDQRATDQRYLPFEGTGVVSGWKLSLPLAQNPINFDLIDDIQIELQYSAWYGGDGFAKSVAQLPALRQRTWSHYVDIINQYPDDWKNFMETAPTGNKQELSFDFPVLQLPNTKQDGLTGFYIQLKVPEGTSTSSSKPYISVIFNNKTTVELKPSANNDFVSAFVRDIQLKNLDPQLKISFNLDSGFTPNSLKENGTNRLSPEILQDIILVLFATGSY